MRYTKPFSVDLPEIIGLYKVVVRFDPKLTQAPHKLKLCLHSNSICRYFEEASNEYMGVQYAGR